MKKIILLIICGYVGVQSANAQDNWFFADAWGETGPGDHNLNDVSGLDVSTNGTVAVAADNDGLRFFSREGTFLHRVSQSERPRDVDWGPDGRLYCVRLNGTHGLAIYNPDFSLARLGGGTTAQGTIIAVSDNLEIFIFRSFSDTIYVFNEHGSLLRSWGTPGSSPGQLGFIKDMAFDPDGNLLVVEQSRTQVFTPEGTFIRSFPRGGNRLDILPGNILVYLNSNANFALSDLQGELLATVSSGNAGVYQTTGFAVDRRGDIWASRDTEIYRFERTYRTTGGSAHNVIPSARVEHVEMRAASGIMDIDFVVEDSDSPLVEVQLLAFVDGVTTFAKILPMNTLVEGSENKLGAPIAANQSHRVSWNIAADWNVDFGNIAIRILAHDQRELIDVHLITIPANNGAPALTINRVPLKNEDFTRAWQWLLASQHPDLQLSAGQIKSAIGNTTYATDSSTTNAGKNWLLNELGYREANTSEIARAREAREGNTSAIVIQDTPRVSLSPANIPLKVNAFGYDTQSTGIWLVPLP